MNKFLFSMKELLITSRRFVRALINRILIYVSTLAVLSIILEYGLQPSGGWLSFLHGLQATALLIFGLGQSLRVFFTRERSRRWIDPALGITGMLLVIIYLIFGDAISRSNPAITQFIEVLALQIFTFFVFIIEAGQFLTNSSRFNLNPAQLFLMSFVLLIVLGTVLLLLPKSTTEKISFIDALFTSTSAVCVTGLATVSTATTFTFFGKFIIMMLIQLGGLGIMTFTTFFGYFFQGSSSLQSRFFMKDFINEENISKVFSTLIKVVLVTFTIELAGAFFIYLSTKGLEFTSAIERLFFSLFHAISAFCNAGFSTLGDGLFDVQVRYNYSLHMIIAVLVIFGGLGFPIMFNYLSLLTHNVRSWVRKLLYGERKKHKARIININSKLAIVTTFTLLLVGFVTFFILEYNHSLKSHDLAGKLVGAFFGSVTPRTAGFNTVDMSLLGNATIMIYLLFMWIGASPSSTGGGIKTTTFALGILNIINIAKGRNRVEIFRREVASDSIRRAYVVTILSLLVIGLATFLLSVFEPGLSIKSLLFESFSAYGTTGLSLGITGGLTTASKIVIIFCMLLGRVGTLTIIVAFLRQVVTLSYRYPTENIIVN